MKIYDKLVKKEARLAVVGLGYVGLPIALEFAKKLSVIGYDIDENRLAKMRGGNDPCNELSPEEFENRDIEFTSSLEKLAEASFFIVAVPTPIDKYNEPDLKPLLGATESVAKVLKGGDYVVYESTVYPGCTEEDCLPLLERSGLKGGEDFKFGYSPERINPGEKVHTLPNTVKIVSGCDAEALDEIAKVYELVVRPGVHRAPNIKVAEAAKIIENTQRDVNIALMNELSIIIGVDPYYLVHKASALKYHCKIISAGRFINDSMGGYIGKKIVKRLISLGKGILGSRILVMGITFKENVSDIRNSKVMDIVNEFKDYGCNVDVMDPYADRDEVLREYGVQLVDKPEPGYDAVVVAVAHNPYCGLSEEYFCSLTKEKAVLADIKGLYKDKISKLSYWSL